MKARYLVMAGTGAGILVAAFIAAVMFRWQPMGQHRVLDRWTGTVYYARDLQQKREPPTDAERLEYIKKRMNREGHMATLEELEGYRELLQKMKREGALPERYKSGE